MMDFYLGLFRIKRLTNFKIALTSMSVLREQDSSKNFRKKVNLKKWHTNIAVDTQSINTRQTRDFAKETGNTETLSSELDSEVI